MASNTILAAMKVLISANTAQFEKSLKQSETIYGRFANTLSNAGKLIGAAFGSVALFNGIKAGIGIMADFEYTMSEVRAITGATGDEFNSLERDALRLGASTKFTATQVGQLQVAYGRLGFTTREILNATEATLDLAAATGEDLAKSADVAGSTVRGFQLNAKETQRVVDVMASSFNKTALGLDNFTESMKYVAPVANAAGATVEETTALLGVLADAGIRGSMAGTSLRKIFTDMTKDGRPLRDRLQELAAKGITLQDSFDEVGRTAQTSLLILSKNTEKTDELTKAFQRASGEASAMARIMQDNLTGDVTKLTSAWEGLILKMSNTGWMRQVTQDLTGMLNLLSGNKDISDQLDKFARAISETNVEAVFDDFIKKISETRKEAGKPIDTKIVLELAEKYKLTDAQANKLYSSVLEINKAMSFQEIAMKQFNEFAERNGYTDLNKAAEDYKQKLYELILAEQIQREGFRKAAESSDDAARAFDSTIKASDNQIAAYRRVINILTEYQQSLQKSASTPTTSGDPNAAATDSLEALKKKLEELNKVYDKMSSKDFVRQAALGREIEMLKDKISLLELIKKYNTEEIVFNDEDNAAKVFEGQMNITGQIMSGLEARVKQFRSTMKKTNTEVKSAVLDMSGAISSGISSIAEGFGNAIAGVGNFGDAVLKAIAGFARQLGESMIAIGTSMLVAKAMIKNPYTAIAAGFALVALSAAMGAAMSSAQKNFNAGGSGSSLGGLRPSADTFTSSRSDVQDNKIIAETILRGQDIYVVLKNYEQSKKLTSSISG